LAAPERSFIPAAMFSTPATMRKKPISQIDKVDDEQRGDVRPHERDDADRYRQQTLYDVEGAPLLLDGLTPAEKQQHDPASDH
jgi:hypothetical protein